MSNNNKLMTVQIEFDKEKLSALKMYLGQKDMKIETELEKLLDGIYTKYVPSDVRSFIDLRAGLPISSTKPKRAKISTPTVEILSAEQLSRETEE